MRCREIPVVVALVLIVAAFPARSTEPDADFASTSVTYVTGSTVYIGAGADDGLGPGDRVELVRDGEVVATLEIEEVSNHRATCKQTCVIR